MKALEIYEQDMADREQGQAMPRQQYYTTLRDALYRELMQQGYSDFLEAMLQEVRGGLARIYVLDYAALMECHSMIVLGRGMRDAEEFVPHLHLRREKVRWGVLEGPGNFHMPVAADMGEKLRQLRAVSRQLVDARDSSVLPQADDAAQREIEQVHMLNKLLDERCHGLQRERDELQARVRELEEGIISEQVRCTIDVRRREEEEALRQVVAAQQEAARAAYQEQFADEIAAAQTLREDVQRQTRALREEAAGDYAAIRQEISADLHQVADMLTAQIGAWQSALNRSECRMLAQAYTALYDLWSEDASRLVLDAQVSEVDEDILTGLTVLRTSLGDRLHQLEQAMLRLGLTVIRPAPGDGFNVRFHLAVGAVKDGTITRCVCPGVMLSGAQDALVRAAVELE